MFLQLKIKCVKKFRFFLNFLLINRKRLRSGKITYSEFVCSQKTYITGLGKVEIGKGCVFGYKPGGRFRNGSIEFQPRYENAIIKLRANIGTNNNLFICAANYIEIGENSRIGENVTLMDFEAHGTHPDKRRQPGKIGKIEIGENVWIGNNVLILKDTYIGRNSIVAAGAVVSGTFPENAIIGGVPAKFIKSIEL